MKSALNKNALVGMSMSPFGGGTLSIILCISLSHPSPVFADILMISLSSNSSCSTKSSRAFWTLADSRSILFITGIIFRFASLAFCRFDRVWAWMLLVASTSKTAPWQALKLRLTWYEKSTCPGVSIKFKRYLFEIILAVWAKTVIPLSLSTWRVSKTWCLSSFVNLVIFPVISSILSANVDLPWSIWAIIEKLRILSWLKLSITALLKTLYHLLLKFNIYGYNNFNLY